MQLVNSNITSKKTNTFKSKYLSKRKLRYFTHNLIEKTKTIIKHKYKKLILFLILGLTSLYVLFLPINTVYIQIENATLITPSTYYQYKNFLKQHKFFFTKTKDLEKELKSKDKKIETVNIQKTIPGKINLKITEKTYILRYSYNKHYYFVTTTGDIIVTDQKTYSKSKLPAIKNIEPKSLQLTMPQLIKLLVLIKPYTQKLNLNISEIAINTHKWEIPTISIKITNSQKNHLPAKFTVLFSPNKPIDKQIAMFANAVTGLSNKNIKYKILDIRFDRVIIK